MSRLCHESCFSNKIRISLRGYPEQTQEEFQRDCQQITIFWQNKGLTFQRLSVRPRDEIGKELINGIFCEVFQFQIPKNGSLLQTTELISNDSPINF